MILMHTGASPFFNNLAFLIKNKTENDFLAIFTSFLKLQNYVFSSKVRPCKTLWISEKDAKSWDFLELNFSPTIYPPIICLKRLFFATCKKKEIPDNIWLSGICLIFLLFSVIRLGLEPRTPTLKVLCSTCWASESILCYCYSSELRVQRYGLFLYLQTFLELFSKKIHFIHFSFIAIKISMYFRQQLPPHTISQ